MSELLFPPGNNTTILLTSVSLIPAQKPFNVTSPYKAIAGIPTFAAAIDGTIATMTAMRARHRGTVGRNGIQKCFLLQNTNVMATSAAM